MPLQRMLAAGRGIAELNSAVTAPGGDGRRLLVQDYGLHPTPANLTRLTKKIVLT